VRDIEKVTWRIRERERERERRREREIDKLRRELPPQQICL
jgi:hypothetical protein